MEEMARAARAASPHSPPAFPPAREGRALARPGRASPWAAPGRIAALSSLQAALRVGAAQPLVLPEQRCPAGLVGVNKPSLSTVCRHRLSCAKGDYGAW